MHGSYQVWSAGAARRSLQPGVRTGNPTPAAAALLGKRRVSRAAKALKRAGKKRAHRGNPLPAVVAIASQILGGKLKTPAQHQADRERVYSAAAQAAQAGIGPSPATANMAPLAFLQDRALNAPTADARAFAGNLVAQLLAKQATAPPVPTALTPAQQALGFLTGPQAGTLLKVAARVSRPRRQRYPSYYDRGGRQHYSYKQPGSRFKLPVGATAVAGAPYRFFPGAVGAGGALATVGQVAVAGAAGAGAYLLTQRLLQYLGGRAQSAEEAGVNAAKALHQSLEDYKAQYGAYPPTAERERMKATYQAKLVELGYDPVTFTRTRSGVAEFLETYNPFGG